MKWNFTNLSKPLKLSVQEHGRKRRVASTSSSKGMRIWLGALDDRLVKVMDAVERNMKEDKPVSMSELTPEGKEASRKLYSILCSYTKGRPYRVVKHTQDENGMEAYRMLMKEYQPVNRARSLELFHNIFEL